MTPKVTDSDNIAKTFYRIDIRRKWHKTINLLSWLIAILFAIAITAFIPYEMLIAGEYSVKEVMIFPGILLVIMLAVVILNVWQFGKEVNKLIKSN